MAVSYAAKVTTEDKLFFLRLLFRWGGSVWQFLWIDFIIYCLMYTAIAFLYRNYLFNIQPYKVKFELVARWLGTLRDSVPISFLLGFFVTSVLGRWWNVCTTIPWVASPAFALQTFVQPQKSDQADIARKIRITLLRWLNIAWILMMGTVSMHIKERFCFQTKSVTCTRKPSRAYKITWRQRMDLINNDYKVKKYFGKLITPAEIEAFGRSAELSNDDDYSYKPEWWLPIAWAVKLLTRAKAIDCITDDRHYVLLFNFINNFRGSLGSIWMLTEFNIPLVYTQVAIFAVYTYLLSGLISMQPIKPYTENAFKSVDNATEIFGFEMQYNPLGYIPMLAAFEFIFYLGWFKIGMCLINPLGKDKEDIPLDDILDSNLKSSIKIGGCEDFLFPEGMMKGSHPEQQILEILNSFDFSEVRCHDKFETPEETEKRLKAVLTKKQLKKLDKVGKAKRDSINNSISKESLDVLEFPKHKKLKKLRAAFDRSDSQEPKGIAVKKENSHSKHRASTDPPPYVGGTLPRCSSDPDLPSSSFIRSLLSKPKFLKSKKPEAAERQNSEESVALLERPKNKDNNKEGDVVVVVNEGLKESLKTQAKKV